MSKAKSNVTADFVLPIVVLVLICAVMSGLLAVTNNITAPIIDAAEKAANAAARLEVLPQANDFNENTEDFNEITGVEGLPDAVTGVFKANNGAGYTFSIVAQGYGGKGTLKMAVGIDMDGKITGVKVLDHKETAGLGSKIKTDASFYGQFPGKDAGYVSDIKNIDTISGATRSSNFYRLALTYAFEAFDMVNDPTALNDGSGDPDFAVDPAKEG